jgi:hypothetical protein
MTACSVPASNGAFLNGLPTEFRLQHRAKLDLGAQVPDFMPLRSPWPVLRNGRCLRRLVWSND